MIWRTWYLASEVFAACASQSTLNPPLSLSFSSSLARGFTMSQRFPASPGYATPCYASTQINKVASSEALNAKPTPRPPPPNTSSSSLPSLLYSCVCSRRNPSRSALPPCGERRGMGDYCYHQTQREEIP